MIQNATVVKGKIVVRDDRLVGISEEDAVRKGQACVAAYLNR